MRHTTRLSILSLTIALAGGATACVGNVGSGGDTRTPRNEDCDKPEKLEASVTIRTMADFDELPTGCWDLFGPLTIQGSEVTSLAPLNKLVGVNALQLIDTELAELDAEMPLKVYGPVVITGNSRLANLDNLEVERAEDLTVNVTVDDNAVLASITGLSELTKLDGDLVITNNPKLANVLLPKLAQVDGATKISNNAALTSVDLAKLAVVRRIELTNNVALTTFGGLAATSIKGDLLIRGNRALTTFGTMTQLDRIEGGLTIDDNDALTTIGMFSTAMQYLTGALVISNNANLADLGRVSRLSGIGSANINSNPKLSSCRITEVQRCVPQLGTFSAVANLNQSNCPTNWCEQ